jgi:hypothetical protein
MQLKLTLSKSLFKPSKQHLRFFPASAVHQSFGSAPIAESARGISPRAAHRTGRKPLDLSGSCHPMKAAAFRQNQRVHPVSS